MKKATGAGDLQGCRKLGQRTEHDYTDVEVRVAPGAVTELPGAQKYLTYPDPVAFARTRCRRQWKLLVIDRRIVMATAQNPEMFKAVRGASPDYTNSVARLNHWVLCGVTLLYIFSVIALLFVPEGGKSVFDSMRTFLPAMATLVIGYYFGKS